MGSYVLYKFRFLYKCFRAEFTLVWFFFSVGYRVWGDFYVGIAVTTYGDNQAAEYTTSVPHPLFFDRPLAGSGRVDDLKRTEIGFHPQILWTRPLTDRMDLALAGKQTTGHPAAQAWSTVVLMPVTRRAGTRVTHAERYASYKLPRRLVVRKELPRNAMGKVVKPELIRELTAAS